MYDIVFTKGNEKTLVGQCDTQKKAKEAVKELGKEVQYKDGLLTIEKDGRIYFYSSTHTKKQGTKK